MLTTTLNMLHKNTQVFLTSFCSWCKYYKKHR